MVARRPQRHLHSRLRSVVRRVVQVAFDEKSPFERLAMLNLVMAHLSDAHKVDLRDETRESSAERMISFLRILGFFKQPEHASMDPYELDRGLLDGDPTTINRILAWLLQRLPELSKRAYLSRFLMDVQVPEHMLADEEVLEVWERHKELQEDFKAAHKAAERLALEERVPPAEMRKVLFQMEQDRTAIEHKVEGLNAKLCGAEGFEAMLVECARLRVEQDEALTLQERFREQRSQLTHAAQRLHHLSARREEIESERGGAGTDESAEGCLRRLQDGVRTLSEQAMHTLPHQIALEQRRVRLHACIVTSMIIWSRRIHDHIDIGNCWMRMSLSYYTCNFIRRVDIYDLRSTRTITIPVVITMMRRL